MCFTEGFLTNIKGVAKNSKSGYSGSRSGGNGRKSHTQHGEQRLLRVGVQPDRFQSGQLRQRQGKGQEHCRVPFGRRAVCLSGKTPLFFIGLDREDSDGFCEPF